MRKLLVAALVAGTAVVPVAVADAAAVSAACRANLVTAEIVTGGQDTFTGAVYGYAVSDTPGASISVSCEVRVNGGTVASTANGPAGQASFTAGQVTYTASDADTVTLCAVWNGSESGEACAPTTTQQVPPQEIVDLGNALYSAAYSAAVEALIAVFAVVGPVVHSTGPIFTDVLDPTLCPFFAALYPGVPGVVNIAPEGDIDLFGDAYYDCPPYDIHG